MMLLKLPFYDLFKRVYTGGDDELTFTRENYWTIAALFILLAVATVAAIWFAVVEVRHWIDKKRSTVETKHGVIIDRIFDQVSEQYTFIVDSDKKYKVEVEMQEYYSHAVNDRIKFDVITGGLSKEILSIKISQNG